MKVSKAFAEDFDRSFLVLRFEGVKIGKAQKPEGSKARCAKGMGQSDTNPIPEVRGMRRAVKASTPSIPQEPVSPPANGLTERERAVRPLPLRHSLRSDHPVVEDPVNGHPSGPDNRRKTRKAKEPVQAQRVGKHHHCAERSVK